MEQIMVVEDEASIRGFIVLSLKHAGFDVLQAETGEEALEILEEKPMIQIILLDVMLPGINGFDVAKQVRAWNKSIGIILLTAKIQEADKVQGLDLGADDYITKPFSPAEMIARVKAVLRRLNDPVSQVQNEYITSSPFKLSKKNEQFFKDDQLIELTPTEFLLIETLMEHEDSLLSRDELLEHVWGTHFGDAKIVDVNIRRLRQKIEEDPSDPQYICTHWGRGYFWHGGSK
ncbi:response regulator transcription factor [Sporolactobacillus kofuensis]|uniref:Response regulator transcription factor n=1 Tax=Sporolactobacillus kofuensis TaxID=269672 RepID=A0ABW1WGR1_9BACL|nr:response regulator transcription factor [Sporolactobacillus kofuensis]MCO7175432.1 response regulator transcription factor [Sporolactobacillus kofuensis]